MSTPNQLFASVVFPLGLAFDTTGNLYVALRKINNECEDLVLPYKCCQIIMKKQ